MEDEKARMLWIQLNTLIQAWEAVKDTGAWDAAKAHTLNVCQTFERQIRETQKLIDQIQLPKP